MSQANSFNAIESFVARFYAGRELLIIPYAYPITFSALAQGASQSGTINIAANADFVMTSVRHRAQIGPRKRSQPSRRLSSG